MLVHLRLLDQLLDEFGCFFDIAFAFILQLSELVTGHDYVVAGLLGVRSSLFGQVLHGGEVLGAPLIFKLVNGQLNLRGCVLLQLDKLLVHVLLIDLFERCFSETLK